MVQQLSADEKAIFDKLRRDHSKLKRTDTKHDRYYEAKQRLEHIGLAVPPELRRFETVINIPRMAVDEPERRMDVKWMSLPGETNADAGLREGWDANNLDSESPLLFKDTMIFGRGYTTVGTNEDDKEHPLVRVESPRLMSCEIDNRKRRMVAALRLYRSPDRAEGDATLYLPDETIWLEQQNYGAWKVVDRDPHKLGKVPVILHLNRRRANDWLGTSEMADVIGLTDSVTRTLTNTQVALETHSLPARWASSVSKGDFVDKDGKPLPVWEAYFTGIWATANKDAKFGSFAAADMKNFNETIDSMLAWCAAVLGLPTRYAGQQSANPASEGAINADERRLIKNVERKMLTLGDSLGWTMALYERFRTGDWLDGNRVHTEWHDASTPTRSERADAIQKLAGGIPILSRQGAWDDMGWSPERKERELEYFRQESESGYLGLRNAEDEAEHDNTADPATASS